MTYRVTNIQPWIITNSANQPQQGFLVTVTDDVTKDLFQLETASVEQSIVEPLIRDHLAKRKATQNLSFE